MLTHYTRALLARWGAWARGRANLGLPSISPMFRDGIPTPVIGEVDSKIAAIEAAVCAAPEHHRLVLRDHYLRVAPKVRKAAEMGVTVKVYDRRLHHAERYIRETAVEVSQNLRENMPRTG